MITAIKAWLVSSLLFGTLSLTTACGPFPSMLASAGVSSPALLKQDILTALNERQSSVQLRYTGKASSLKTDIKNTLEAAIRADDYLHYIVKTYGYKATIRGNTATIDFSFTYWETLAQSNEVKANVARTLKRILLPGMSDHQKEKVIHDWIVTNLSYDTRLISHSAYDGLMEGSTVCQGYALLTYEMMRQAGIPVKIVEGTSRGQAHTWNLVQIGGKWYHIDTTWNDPVPDTAGKVYYNYYNLTDSQLRVDHKWKPSAEYPLAVSDYGKVLTALAAKGSDFYKKLYGQLGFVYLEDAYTVADVDGLAKKIRAAVDAGEHELVLRYTRGATVKSDLQKALNGQKGISGISYTYEDYTRSISNDKLIRIKLKY
ncbi:transglutaminase domain-containing protein [Cohnella terricola]|nr:transglutaminase domain-containing protein [Cohnella terricola]